MNGRCLLDAWSVASFLLILFAGGCRTTPITGRAQLLLLPEQQEIAMGLAAFEETKTTEPLSTNPQYLSLVNRVGQRIAQAADRPDYQWEFRVIASAEQNAYCLPGGKVTIHEGILPVCGSEAGLAVVMSHEVSHALARHGGERMSHNMAVDGVKRAVEYFTKDKEQRQRELILQAYGVGTQYGVVLPYSRKHEYEADHMGLMLLAKAGYDPAEAPRFWQRFSQVKQGSSPAEFLSTHPTDGHRAENLAALLPEAQALYAQAAQQYGLGEAISAPPIAAVASSVPANTATSTASTLSSPVPAGTPLRTPPLVRQ